MKHILLVLFLMSLLVNSRAQYGELDLNFDADGMLTLNLNDSTSVAYDIAALSDGKILIAGYAFNGHDKDFALVRVHPDGSPDLSFGTDGWALTDFSSNDDKATSMKIQKDGKIVLGGRANNDKTFAIARYNKDGTPDNSFSSDGKDTSGVGIISDFGPSLMLQNDGKFIIAGTDYHDADYYCCLVRYTSSGIIDTTFHPDNTVKAFTNCGTLQADGKILAGGQFYNGTEVDFIVARFNTDGSIDNSFSFDGKVTSDYAQLDVINGLTELKNKDILAVGYYYTAVFGVALLRYKPDGMLDDSFAENGIFRHSPDADGHAYRVFEQPDSKILIAGSGPTGNNSQRFELLRLTGNGELDTTFGIGGQAVTNFNNYFLPYSIAIQPDGKILECGISWIEDDPIMTVLRFTSGLPPVVSIKNSQEDPIHIFPNPFSDDLNISIPESEKNSKLEIYSYEGRMVYAINLKEESQTIILNFLPSGAYIARIVNEETVYSRLIIKE